MMIENLNRNIDEISFAPKENTEKPQSFAELAKKADEVLNKAESSLKNNEKAQNEAQESVEKAETIKNQLENENLAAKKEEMTLSREANDDVSYQKSEKYEPMKGKAVQTVEAVFDFAEKPANAEAQAIINEIKARFGGYAIHSMKTAELYDL